MCFLFLFVLLFFFILILSYFYLSIWGCLSILYLLLMCLFLQCSWPLFLHIFIPTTLFFLLLQSQLHIRLPDIVLWLLNAHFKKYYFSYSCVCLVNIYWFICKFTDSLLLLSLLMSYQRLSLSFSSVIFIFSSLSALISFSECILSILSSGFFFFTY